jgi:F0F1-type ATP synthase membrane subunit c/vacuolar-type H+-ATPase subunit K
MPDIIDHYLEIIVSNPELQGKILVYGQYLVVGMMILGYLIMAYLLFVH